MTRVAVVTGGSRGIGAAAARALADDGWMVCLSYRTNRQAADSVVADCPGGQAIRVDLADERDIVRLFAAADEVGPLGALVNNAGVVDIAARVEELTAERIDRMFAVNVRGPFLCAREAVIRMSTSHGGHGGAIVNVSSIASRLGGSDQYVDYAASKAAIDTLTIGLAREVATDGIRVNCVRPGVIDTDIHAAGGQPDRASRLAPTIPMGRPGRPDEVAAMIRWLCSDEASYVTGALIDVGGGR